MKAERYIAMTAAEAQALADVIFNEIALQANGRPVLVVVEACMGFISSCMGVVNKSDGREIVDAIGRLKAFAEATLTEEIMNTAVDPHGRRLNS